jgi:hypothetical protein
MPGTSVQSIHIIDNRAAGVTNECKKDGSNQFVGRKDHLVYPSDTKGYIEHLNSLLHRLFIELQYQDWKNITG